MHLSFLDRLECDRCHAMLRIERGSPKDGALSEGRLRCTACENYLVVQGGIIRTHINTNHQSADDLRKQTEMMRRDFGAHRYDKYFSNFANLAEAESILYDLMPCAEDLVLELGIGTGRIAASYGSQIRELIGIDLSIESLQIARQRLQDRVPYLCLIQGDICTLPIRSNSIGKVVSPEVFEHLPSAASRNDALIEARRVLQPGGLFVLTVYNYSALKQLRNLLRPGSCPKEDLSADYAYRFFHSEFRKWLATHFEIQKISGVRCTVLERLDKFGRFMLFAERLIQQIPFSSATAHLLQGVARKPRAGPVCTFG